MGVQVVQFYTSFKQGLFLKSHDLTNDDIKLMLVTSGYTPNNATHTTTANITNQVANGNGYTTGGVSLTSKTVSSGTNPFFDSADPEWTASGGSIVARRGILYNNTNGYLIGHFLLDDTPADVTITNGTTFSIRLGASGWFTLSS